MLNLNGLLSVDVVHEITQYTELRLRDKSKYQCAEALALYEQRIMSNEEIFALCEETCEEDLYIPATSYIPTDIIRHFQGSDVVPVSYSPIRRKVTCVALKDIGEHYNPLRDIEVEVVHTPIYNYFQEYIRQYGHHPDLLDVPAKQILDSIVNEAISLDAADITISSKDKSAQVYYNVRKKKVYSQRIISYSDLNDIIKLMCFESPMDYQSNDPKYVGVTLNDMYRGRVVINHKFHGYAITIRLLPNEAFNKKLNNLGLSKETIEFIRRTVMSPELGLRIIAGATMSGKNTTALATLSEILDIRDQKVISVEMPVEQELVGVEQINCDTYEEYNANINSLIRQNPDFVYITEMEEGTATPVMRTTNTGKKVLSTTHANSCADVITRLIDMTGLPPDRIIQSIQSILYQELVRDDATDTVRPRNKYVHLSLERKNILYGAPYGDVIKKIQSWEGGDVW